MSSSLAETIASEIRAEMGRQNVTHKQLADHLGYAQPQVSKRLRGVIEFRPNEVEKVAAFLGVPVLQFFPVPSAA